METILKLSLDKDVIENAEIFANENGQPLSKMVEDYVKSPKPSKRTKRKSRPEGNVTDLYDTSKADKDFDEVKIKPESKFSELAGILKVPNDFDYKKVFEEEILKKYGF